jgi:hypothetical protein
VRSGFSRADQAARLPLQPARGAVPSGTGSLAPTDVGCACSPDSGGDFLAQHHRDEEIVTALAGVVMYTRMQVHRFSQEAKETFLPSSRSEPPPTAGPNGADANDSAARPGPGQPIGFTEHIKLLFRASDSEAMKWGFNLAAYADVTNRAAILQPPSAGSMRWRRAVAVRSHRRLPALGGC